MFNIRSTKLTVSATKSTATSCQIQVVAICCQNQQQSWPYRHQSTFCRFVAGFGNSQTGNGNSRLSTKSTVLNPTLSLVCTGLCELSVAAERASDHSCSSTTENHTYT